MGARAGCGGGRRGRIGVTAVDYGQVLNSARHGHTWWELDVTWLTIRLLGAVGLARRIATPRPDLRTVSSRPTK